MPNHEHDIYFSVIIPTLNEEKFVPKLLADLTKQSEKNFEVVVIDGNSEDKTVDEVKLFAAKLNLNCILSKKRNLSHQRNIGCAEAKGKYLVIIDADSRIKPNFLKQIRRSIEKKHGLVFLISPEPEEKSPDIIAFYQIMNFIIDISQNTAKPLPTSGCVVFETNFFRLIGGYLETIFVYEDQHILQKAQLWGVKAKYLSDVKFKFSFRRVRKEGKLTMLYKAVYGTTHVLLNKGPIKEKIFDYQMGGKYHLNKSEPVHQKYISEQFHKLKELLDKIRIDL